MIPHQLTLKNFLSYENATLEFRGLHTACICGPNGAGKSSLLEAISWSIWGESRAGSEDDVIHFGAKEARVDYVFQVNGCIYRVIRCRVRGQLTSLEFQVATVSDEEGRPVSFKSLSERGLRATQEKVLEHLKLDYETFSNSAYLRQGRADEFMLKRPNERKEILAELLKLNHYDRLAEEAKERAKNFKGKVELLEVDIYSLQSQLEASESTVSELAETEASLNDLQAKQVADELSLKKLKEQAVLRQSWLQQVSWHRQQYQAINGEGERLEQDLAMTRSRQQQLEAVLHQEKEITSGYANFQQLQSLEQLEDGKFQLHQELGEKRSSLQQQLSQHLAQLSGKLSSAKAQLDSLLQQEEELQQILQSAPEVEAGLAQLQLAKTKLADLDRLQGEIAPLINRRNHLQVELERVGARLGARLEEIQATGYQLHLQQQRHPQLQQAVIEIGVQIEELEKKRIYQQRVREKGLERRSFMERLQTQQREYETRLAGIQEKMGLMQKYSPEDAGENSNLESAFPLCPLCDRPLDEHHRNLVLEKHATEQQDILNQLWVVREQLATSEREIQVLRTEYQQLTQELAGYDTLRERRGNLLAQLDATTNDREKLQHLSAEKQQLEQILATGTHSPELQSELQQLERQLQQLNYDEKTHALARGNVERWRWAEIKQAEIKSAMRRWTQLQLKKPELEALVAKLSQDLEQQKTISEYSQAMAEIDRQLTEINYDRHAHSQVRETLKKAQIWLAKYQELLTAREEYPQFVKRAKELETWLEERRQQRQKIAEELEILNRQLFQTPDPSTEIQNLDRTIAGRRTQLDQLFASKGRLQQQQQYRASLETQLKEKRAYLQNHIKQQRIYSELAAAFGKNGIQALMIENVLPQLEAETNQILSRLSANQLHIQFVTQKASKTKTKSAKTTGKLIETLDILIADARGTRPYETYSGGEAFRINFAIRLALARLLANRSGTALQMLIVDEGFGTQDSEGCDRLIAAINAIASEFACILTVTHMPQFKEAFQARIEVNKTQNGSQIQLSV
ncbi:exonuclease subunit SbcC [Ancylothrix sp. C2]|uniref:exonuclease subunit SbcC n=1 Tax=Ancylothrix sp. D3o TaxID=2953691 RepID=UPI0021BBB621|nr:exonuclease subunit SbcC [Ancylothrix sp. D3o]MCT7949124.1 exonuclease subunit SbcC [Ancylothrix sp. D3o]